MFNQTNCEASLLNEMKLGEVTVPCTVTQRKQLHQRKEQRVQISVDINQKRLQVTIRGNVEGQDESSRYKIGLKISFKVSFFILKLIIIHSVNANK